MNDKLNIPVGTVCIGNGYNKGEQIIGRFNEYDVNCPNRAYFDPLNDRGFRWVIKADSIVPFIGELLFD